MKKIWIAIATFFGTGYLPVAPGTWASLLTALIVYFTPLSSAPFLPAGPGHGGRLRHRHSGRRQPAKSISQKKDPRPCVIDEVAGQLVSLWFLPRQAGYLHRRLFSLPFFRHFQTVPGKPERSPAARLRHHDRRRAGRSLHPGGPAAGPPLSSSVRSVSAFGTDAIARGMRSDNCILPQKSVK